MPKVLMATDSDCNLFFDGINGLSSMKYVITSFQDNNPTRRGCDAGVSPHNSAHVRT